MKPNNHSSNLTSQFSTMWHWTNIATDTDPRTSYKHKIVAINNMWDAVTSETMEHFLSALREVLRSAQSHEDFSVRMKSIELLAQYSNWEDLEWTLWLHEKRSHCTFSEWMRIKRLRGEYEQKLWEAKQETLLKQHLEKLERV